MISKDIDRNLILLLTLIILVLQKTSYKAVILIAGIFLWAKFYSLNKDDSYLEFILSRMLVLSVPLSFVSISGRLYSQSIISWFNLFFVFLTGLVIVKNLANYSFSMNKLSFISLKIIVLGIVPIFISKTMNSAIKQYINFVIPFVLIIVGNNVKYFCSMKEKKILLYDYIFAANIVGIGTLLQYIAKRVFNIVVGNYSYMGGYRHGFGFLFADFSFLSLYLVTGAALLLYLIDEGKIDMKKGVINIVFLVITSIMTSARTGVFSFIVVFGLFVLPKFFYYLIYNFPRVIALTLAVVLLLGSSLMLVGRVRGNRKFSDSGRGTLNEKAFKLFLEKPIFGVGFGSDNYSKISGMLPHNLIFQYLAQGGLILCIPLFIALIMILAITKKNDIVLFGAILCILIGSLFIPNIFNSRYMGAIFLIFSIRDVEDIYSENAKEIEYES